MLQWKIFMLLALIGHIGGIVKCNYCCKLYCIAFCLS